MGQQVFCSSEKVFIEQVGSRCTEKRLSRAVLVSNSFNYKHYNLRPVFYLLGLIRPVCGQKWKS